jgi:hypothetical protein
MNKLLSFMPNAELLVDPESALEMVRVLRTMHQRNPMPEQWNTLFSTEGYQALFQKADSVGAVPPCTCQDIRTYVSQVSGWIGEEYYVISNQFLWTWTWEHLDEVESYCLDFGSHRGCSKEIVQRALRYVPDGSIFGQVHVYLMIRGVFGAEVDEPKKNILLDVPDPLLFGKERLVSILSHELVHIYQYELIVERYSPEAMRPEERILFERVIRPVAMEGGAEAVVDVEKMIIEASTAAEKAFVKAVYAKPRNPHEHDGVLDFIQSEIYAVLGGQQSPEEADRIIEARTGADNVNHAVGAQMARLIEEELGREVLRHSHDPITFFSRYQEAAKRTKDCFVFDDKAFVLLKEHFRTQ